MRLSIPGRLRRRGLAAMFCAAVFAACSADAAAQAADDGPSAVPYRPGLATPAALSAPGWLEIEGALQHDREQAAASTDSAPFTLKLAFTPDWGVRLEADGWLRRHDPETRASGFGDTAVILKRRFAVDDDSAFGLEAGATLPTARHGLGSGSGKTDLGLNGIYSADLAPWHVDLNIATSRLGRVDPGSGRVESLFVAALSRSLGERWSAGAELSASHRRGEEGMRQLLVGTSYSVSRRLVLDAGAARSLRGGPPVWSVFTGFTWLTARVF
jgi:outer membrane putative beta-barrel porin/alpha-amylase